MMRSVITFGRRLLFSLLGLILLLWLLFYFASSTAPLPSPNISSKDVATSRQLLVTTVQHLRRAPGGIALTFDQQQLDALLNVAGYAAAKVQFSGHINDYGVALHAHADASMLWPGRSVRLSCLLLPDATGFAISHCQLGRLPLSAYLVHSSLKVLLKHTLVAPADEQLLALFSKGQIADGKLHFVDANASAIALQLKPNFYQATELALGLTPEHSAVAADVSYYLQQLHQLSRQHPAQRQLAFYLQQLLLLAEQRSQHPQQQLTQYRSALWALIAGFGHRGFIRYANPALTAAQVPLLPRVLLANRADLSLHFLYSAALQMLSSSQLSVQIGNLKEILDADTGGSGFSFIDLVADQAGTLLAERLADIDIASVKSLSVAEFEASFMPALSDFTEGLSEQDMKLNYDGFDGEQYQHMQQRINARLSQLTLYRRTN